MRGHTEGQAKEKWDEWLNRRQSRRLEASKRYMQGKINLAQFSLLEHTIEHYCDVKNCTRCAEAFALGGPDW